jgi:hypothetical protein
MVMTKTELKKQLVAAALELLENEFGVEFDGTDEGGRLGFTLPEIINAGSFIFRGDFSRRDMEVCLWESIPLHQRGLFDETEVLIQQQAVSIRESNQRSIGGIGYPIARSYIQANKGYDYGRTSIKTSISICRRIRSISRVY